MELFTSGAYAPFVAAILLVVVLGVFEVIGLISVGMGMSDFAEWLSHSDTLPETAFTNWLIVRGLPLSIAVVLYLTCFGTAGIAVQQVSSLLTGAPLPVAVAVVSSLFVAWVGFRVGGRWMSPLFADNSQAVSADSLIGLTGSIVDPRCARGKPAEVQVRDIHGMPHMLMVVPLDESDEFVAGDRVTLVGRIDRALFSALKA